MTDLREEILHAMRLDAEAHIEKHRMNVEVYLTNPVGVGEHSEVMEEIEKQLELMAQYHDQLEMLETYF